MRENDRALDEIFQLAYISRPVPARQPFHSGSRNGFDLLLHAASVLLREVAHQERDIVRPFPQGRNANGEYVQTVI